MRSGLIKDLYNYGPQNVTRKDVFEFAQFIPMTLATFIEIFVIWSVVTPSNVLINCNTQKIKIGDLFYWITIN